MFRATLSNPMLFVNSISTIAELIDEGVFRLEKDGINFIAADRAMVAVVDFSISSSAFEKYEIDQNQNIGLNVTNFLSVLKRVSGNDKLSLSLQDNKLEVLIEGSSKRRFLVPLLDLSAEEVPPIDQLNFTAKLSLKPDVLQSGIDDAEIISDAVMFEASGSKFTMRSEGDVSKAELELEKGNTSLMDISADAEVKSRYPLEYLKKIIKAGKIADAVSLQFGQDYPMKLEFKSGDKAHLMFVIAPRVSDE